MKSDIDKVKGSNNIPNHLAIIMDGNGRWALKHNYSRTNGHKKGIETLRNVITECIEIGVKILTVYAFSTENWKRPKEEVEFLMTLLLYYLRNEIEELNKNKIKLNFIGRINELPKNIVEEINRAQKLTEENNRLILNIAVNYGGRAEIIDAVNRIISLKLNSIDENEFKDYLYFKNQPYPDLIIRTGGEMRISNFLLWEMAYSELYFTNVLWPDFSKEDLYKAIYEYSFRERRYGGL
ncbi:MAG: isoprenyl transferase [Thermoanaerobacteraceae bacterium]|nr:isoprenyl transferase [Thermoanaerobacteraceae bacterium]